MKTIKETIKNILKEDSDNIKYDVVSLGGSIGKNSISSISELKGKSPNSHYSNKLFDNLNDAKAKSKRLNAGLSPGEKSYYKIKYVVAQIINGKYTGK